MGLMTLMYVNAQRNFIAIAYFCMPQASLNQKLVPGHRSCPPQQFDQAKAKD